MHSTSLPLVSARAIRKRRREDRVRQFLAVLPQPLSLVRWPVKELNRITRKFSAFASFADLLDAEGGYFPSLGSTSGKDAEQLRILAEAYDAAQQERGDARRAFRWGLVA